MKQLILNFTDTFDPIFIYIIEYVKCTLSLSILFFGPNYILDSERNVLILKNKNNVFFVFTHDS